MESLSMVAMSKCLGHKYDFVVYS